MLRSALLTLALLSDQADTQGIPDDAVPQLQICNPVMPASHADIDMDDSPVVDIT